MGDDVQVSARILVVDNYDSFVFNIVQYLEQLGADCTVVRNDEVDLDSVTQFDGVLLSPGPGTPSDAGLCEQVIRQFGGQVPIFGVCLGHQAIGEVFGATVNRAPELLHGKVSQVEHHGTGVFAGIPSPFTATRYHSLAIDSATVPSELEVTAQTAGGVIMGVRHRELPIEGVQFHPESVLTEHGHRLLANWLAECGDERAVAASAGLTPVIAGESTP